MPTMTRRAALLLPACYHATIETGATASTTVIRKGFASGWIYGLVPPKAVETASKCPDGVARVETQLSFVNQLVGFLTLGIYTPMEIVVTCAEPAAMSSDATELVVPAGDGALERRTAMAAAVARAVETGGPVLVRF
jgi:Bor protein